MPTYDYGCEACGATWELEQRITEDPIKTCPECKKMKAKRLISGGNFILKGSGWYADLYHKPKESSSKKTSSDGDGGGSSETKPETKSETKSETTSETKSASTGKSEKKAKKAASG